jgi:hypothetical protein
VRLAGIAGMPTCAPFSAKDLVTPHSCRTVRTFEVGQQPAVPDHDQAAGGPFVGRWWWWYGLYGRSVVGMGSSSILGFWNSSVVVHDGGYLLDGGNGWLAFSFNKQA